jgi:cleavage and polyadenylation specificity factor subunit 3
MFGDNAVTSHKGDNLTVVVNEKTVMINSSTLEVSCEDDEILRDMIFTAVNKLNQVLVTK